MKSIYLFLSWLVITVSSFAQQRSTVKWGEDFKFRKGTTDLKVILSDKTGAYLQESHVAVKTYYVIGGDFRGSATLVKMNANLAEVYRHSFNKELRGKQFVQFFSCGNNLYIFSSAYNRSERQTDIFAAKVDKSTGKLAVAWKQLTSLQQEKRKDKFHFKLTYNADSSKMVIVSSVEGKERNEYRVQEFDSNLKASAKPIIISNEFEVKKFQLEDLLYTINRKVILVGRVYEYEDGKKKKEKFLDFSHYNIRVYDEKGKRESEINTSINGKWLSSTKVLQEKNQDLVLAAFYSNEKKGNTIDGLLTQRIDITNGKVLSTSAKQINRSLLSAERDSTDNDVKEDKNAKESQDKTKEESEGFSRYMKFRNIFYTTDGGLVILAESYNHYLRTSSSYSPGTNGSPGKWTSTTYSIYKSGDIMMCKINAAGDIDWLQVQPKDQDERYVIGRETNIVASSPASGGASFFAAVNMPFYSGFGAMKIGSSIQIIFNDNPKNAAVVDASRRMEATYRFSKSDCFILDVDVATGKFSRKLLFSNDERPTAMPRVGSVIGNEMYLVGRADRLFGKTRVSVGKIMVK